MIRWGLVFICAISVLGTGLAAGHSQAQRSRCPDVQRKGKPPQRMCVSGRWYRATSAWNTRIPRNPPIAPRSRSLISAFNDKWCKQSACLGPTMVSVPTVWIASSSTPLTTIQVNYPRCDARRVRAPIPPGAVPEGPPEGGMVVMIRDTGVEWNFFKLTQPGVKPLSSGPLCAESGSWAATVVTKAKPGWTGSGTARTSPRGSGTLFGTGLIRPRDTKRPAGSSWDHALALAYPGTLAGAYARPATHSDGTCTDPNACIPMGARIQLDPSVRCGEWPGLAVWQQQLCRTLQNYGMIVVDTGSALLIQNPRSVGGYAYPWEPGWGTLPPELATRLRIVDWAKWTGSR